MTSDAGSPRLGRMSEVVITVRGEAERRVAPERALVRVTVRADGPDRGPVLTHASTSADPLRDQLRDLQNAGAVAEWSSGRVNVWSERPWSHDGRQLPLVHHAAVEIRATFLDTEALSRWAEEIAGIDAVQLDGIEWGLHPETRRDAERETAADAVRVAVVRAEAYAHALDRRQVTPVQIADVGLLADGNTHARAGAPELMRAVAADSGAPSFALQPADIVVAAAVEARFTAS